jgi:hypothetical protein
MGSNFTVEFIECLNDVKEVMNGIGDLMALMVLNL